MCDGTVQLPGATPWVNVVPPSASRSSTGVRARRPDPIRPRLFARALSRTTRRRFGARRGTAELPTTDIASPSTLEDRPAGVGVRDPELERGLIEREGG